MYTCVSFRKAKTHAQQFLEEMQGGSHPIEKKKIRLRMSSYTNNIVMCNIPNPTATT